MYSLKKRLKISRGFKSVPSKEEFLRLPRVESLLDMNKSRSPQTIEKMLANPSVEMTNQMSMKAPDNRMVDCGICKGDYVVIQKKRKYKAGDIIAVKLGNRVFVRKYFPGANRIRLESNSPEKQMIILDLNTPGYSILGKVIQVIRTLEGGI